MLSRSGASKSPSFLPPSKAVVGADFRVGPSSHFSVPSVTLWQISFFSPCPLCSYLRALCVKSFFSSLPLSVPSVILWQLSFFSPVLLTPHSRHSCTPDAT